MIESKRRRSCIAQLINIQIDRTDYKGKIEIRGSRGLSPKPNHHQSAQLSIRRQKGGERIVCVF